MSRLSRRIRVVRLSKGVPRWETGGAFLLIKLEFTGDFAANQRDDALANIRASKERGLPFISEMAEPHDGVMAIVGNGPSLTETFEELRDKDWFILSVNGAHDFLIERGIEPDGWAFIEVDRWGEPLCVLPSRQCTYYIASQCHPEIFESLSDRNIVLWHLWQDIGEAELLKQYESLPLLIGGGTAPTLRAINLGMVLGYRKFEMFGVDGSYLENSHASVTGQRFDWKDHSDLDVICAGRRFLTKGYLAHQARDFDLFYRRHGHLFDMNFHGDGLIPHIHRTLTETKNAKH